MKANDRIQQWLSQTSTTCTIVYIGLNAPTWDKQQLHDQYYITLTNTRGTMQFPFWDSVVDTQLHHQTQEGYSCKYYNRHYCDLTYRERQIVNKSLADAKSQCKITEYDIFSCLTLDDPGMFNEFCRTYGYSDDSISALRTYQACCDEYTQLHRLFTHQDLRQLQSIINGD